MGKFTVSCEIWSKFFFVKISSNFKLVSKTLLYVMGILVILTCHKVNSGPIGLEYDVEGDLSAPLTQRDARFFGFGNKIADYSPYNYYGYGYRPFWGNFGGYLGFFGR
jgi:hypothetical protein